MTKQQIEEQRKYEKYVRWQEIRVTQFGYVNYLILTLASGALVYNVSPLTDSDGCAMTLCSSLLYWLALLFLLISVIVGIVCAYIRLCDFRDTAKVAEYYFDGQKSYTDQGKRLKNNDEATSLHQKAERFGKCSWTFLWWQIGFFGAGIIFLGVVLFVSEIVSRCG